MIEHPAFTVGEWSVREMGLHLDALAQTESGQTACSSTTNPNRRLRPNNPTDQLDLHGQEAQTETWKAFMTACTKSDISFSCIKPGDSRLLAA
jgi:hypothetical protein